MSKELYEATIEYIKNYNGESWIATISDEKYIDMDTFERVKADLEAKLAEKEERINWLVEAEFNRKWAKKYVEMRREEDPMLCLPDSDEVYEKYFELKQQLAEKEKEIEKVKEVNLDVVKKQIKFYNQDKISFAVEQLVNIQMYISDNPVGAEQECFGREINDFIDNQIKRLKEMK